MKNTLKAIALAAAVAFAPQANAVEITYSGYDINDAIISGHGNWFHTYTGTITPGANFVHLTWPGTSATYNGVGSGTLNDGVIGTSESNTQLFITPQASDGTLINPAIFLTLPIAYTIDHIEIYGGDINGNTIPGALTGVTVGLLDTTFALHSHNYSLSPFGAVGFGGVPVNDEVFTTGTPLENIGAFTVILSNFQGTNADWFSITEIKLYGEEYHPETEVPEPASLLLLGGGVLAAVRSRRKAS